MTTPATLSDAIYEAAIDGATVSPLLHEEADNLAAALTPWIEQRTKARVQLVRDAVRDAAAQKGATDA